MAGVNNDQKIMDVSKPGRGKVVSTSRPVVAPIVSKPKSKAADTPADDGQKSGSSHKVIQPISGNLDENEAVAVSVGTDGSQTDAPDTAAPDTAAVADQSEEKPAETKTEFQEEPSSEASDAAGVDTLAASAETKKQAAKKAEEQAKRDAELEELIASKKYAVPIKHGVGSGASGVRLFIIGIVIVAVLLAGAYMLMQAGVFGSDFNLFGYKTTESESVESPTPDAGTNPAASDQADANENADLPQIQRAEDDERKNELKSLQQRLETYFNDNDEYPLELSGLTPAPASDELTDPEGVTYTYEGDGQTYTLSAKLSDGTTYTLNSVNQAD